MRNIWTIVGAIAAVLTLGLAVLGFYNQYSESKRIETKLISRSILVNENVSKAGRPIEILLDGRKVSNFAIMTFRIANVGKEPIRNADYEKPISLIFSDIQDLLYADTTARDPEDLGIKANLNQSNVELSTGLLNPGDWFSIEVGVIPLKGRIPTFKPEGRIAGVKRIELQEAISESLEKPSSKWVHRLGQIQTVLSLFLAIYVLWLFWNTKRVSEEIQNTICQLQSRLAQKH